MRKFNFHYMIAVGIFVFLVVIVMFKGGENDITFYGFAENKETDINLESAVEIKKIYVSTGQRVKKNQVLLDVISSYLPIEIGHVNYKIEELQTEYELWKSNLDWKISQLNIQINEKTSDIQSQISIHQSQLDKNRLLAQDIKSISLDDLKSNEIKNPLTLKIAALKKELKFIKSIINTEIENLKSERLADNNPILSKINALKGEQDYNDLKKKKQTILAPSDGLVGNIHCKENEKKGDLDVLITFYDQSPTSVIGYIHECHILKVQVGDSVEVFSSSRPDISTMGVVKNRGLRIIEIPSRLRKFKDYVTYGREIIIEIPPSNPFLQKEKVTLNLKNNIE